ncbi:hypothetical protein Tco_1274759, partial [Tanacetum coccineum]
IGVNAGESKLMLLGINLRLLEKVNAVRHNLLLLVLLGLLQRLNEKTVNGEVQLHSLVDRKKVIINESIIRRDLQLEDAEGTDFLPNATIFEQLTHMGKPKRKDTEIPQSSGPIEPIADEAANEENVPTHSNDPLLSDCSSIEDFKFEVESQEVWLSDQGWTASKQRRKITDIDQDAEVTLVEETQGRYDDAQMFDTDVLNGEEVFVAEQSEKVVEEVVSTAEVSVAATITTKEITLAQALAELRSAKPKVVVQDPVKSTTITTPSTIPKAKSITLETLLQAEEEEQARLARENAEKVEEANIS